MIALQVLSGAALADPPAPPASQARYCESLLGEGASSVTSENAPVSRVGDGQCVVAVEGSADVFVEGPPALRVGDRVRCRNGKTGLIVGGATSVFVNGRPLAGAGSRVAGC
jgi:uncharacterized Zn-binding protein involved in type VI secretion